MNQDHPEHGNQNRAALCHGITPRKQRSVCPIMGDRDRNVKTGPSRLFLPRTPGHESFWIRPFDFLSWQTCGTADDPPDELKVGVFQV
jgi:hypothetical protein